MLHLNEEHGPEAAPEGGNVGFVLDFEDCYNRYSGCIYLFLHQYVLDVHIRQDIVQDIFVKLWKKRGQMMSQDHAGNWLYKVARTTAIDFLRKQQKGDQPLEAIVPLMDDNYVEMTFMAFEGLNWIYEAMRSLPNGQQDVIKGWLIDDLTIKEIARKRASSVKTVYSQRDEALKRIRQWIDHEGSPKTVWILFILTLIDEAC